MERQANHLRPRVALQTMVNDDVSQAGLPPRALAEGRPIPSEESTP